MRIVNVLYGCIKSSLLWYNLFSETLYKIDFIINPYDICIANTKINGKQCKITWYVDNLKVLHVELSAVESVIKAIESYLGR